jgi:PleD family two-component response regulator
MIDIDHFKRYNDTYGHLEGIKNAVQKLEIPHDGSPLGRVTISCGCTVIDAYRDGLSAPWLIKQSDDALYEAKSQGRDRYIIRNIESKGPLL